MVHGITKCSNGFVLYPDIYINEYKWTNKIGINNDSTTWVVVLFIRITKRWYF